MFGQRLGQGAMSDERGSIPPCIDPPLGLQQATTRSPAHTPLSGTIGPTEILTRLKWGAVSRPWRRVPRASKRPPMPSAVRSNACRCLPGSDAPNRAPKRSSVTGPARTFHCCGFRFRIHGQSRVLAAPVEHAPNRIKMRARGFARELRTWVYGSASGLAAARAALRLTSRNRDWFSARNSR